MSNKLYSKDDENYDIGSSFLKLMGGLFLIGVTFCLTYLYTAFAIGYVGMNLWAWFVVPVFGLPAISWGQSYGIALVLGLYTHKLNINTNKDEREKPEKIGHAIASLIFPWIFLLAGWVGKTFFL
jgi:hypothetical protein